MADFEYLQCKWLGGVFGIFGLHGSNIFFNNFKIHVSKIAWVGFNWDKDYNVHKKSENSLILIINKVFFSSLGT